MNPAIVDTQAPGSIQLITGPMWSGKTSELIRICNRYKIQHQRVMIVKSEKIPFSSKYYVTSHDKFVFFICFVNLKNVSVSIEAHATLRLMDIIHDLKNQDVIGVDEGQFVSLSQKIIL